MLYIRYMCCTIKIPSHTLHLFTQSLGSTPVTHLCRRLLSIWYCFWSGWMDSSSFAWFSSYPTVSWRLSVFCFFSSKSQSLTFSTASAATLYAIQSNASFLRPIECHSPGAIRWTPDYDWGRVYPASLSNEGNRFINGVRKSDPRTEGGIWKR